MTEIFRIIRNIDAEERMSTLLVDRSAWIALDLAGYGYVMENGRIVLDVAAEKRRGHEEVRESCLGVGAAGERNSYRDLRFSGRRRRWLGRHAQAGHGRRLVLQVPRCNGPQGSAAGHVPQGSAAPR